ncbi:hypothetical protein [Rhizobacter sp. Root1221]|uniref:hypothetical protein n=1 Tax=Rhizobacter sp. Root1221 TaxID=1736433 RepID=UPI0006F846A8|nr:hypothetical protein [Rhizobacter sp. Root1221]KQV99978.1 hypothetical protein ASC87_19960 [Rhizobacter sp. Root1221]
MSITAEQIVELFDEDHEDLEEIEEGEWTCEYKDNEYRSDIMKHLPTDTFWRIDLGRSGSYYTEFFYEDTEATQVRPVEKVVTTTEWKVVK